MADFAVKVRWRIVFPTILFMLMSSLDRANISFAALEMNADLGFSPTEYGFGAGLLFVGFLAGQYPSVLLHQRIGMRRWIASLALTWGTCAGSLAFITETWQFYSLRIMIGFAEGGLAPGIVLYLSQFATERERAATFAMPALAIPLSIIIGGPLSGWLMQQPALGLSGWRWMFIGEALPTILLGLAALIYFPDRPEDATWLTREEKEWLKSNAVNRPHERQANDWSVLANPLIWLCALLWFCLLSGAYGIMFWLPQMVGEAADLTPLQIGVINSLPWLGVGLGMYFNSAHSDRTGERFWHVGLPAAVTSLALLAGLAVEPGPVSLVALFIAGLALGSAQGAFWAIPTQLFAPATFAVGAVAINIVGSAGGLVIPPLLGALRERTGSFVTSNIALAAVLMLAVVLVVVLRTLLVRHATTR